MLTWAYRRGAFPMTDPLTGVIDWYSPDPRGIIPLDEFHLPKNLARLVRQGRFHISSDRCFEQVMHACAAPRADDDQTWIDDRLIRAYCGLHQLGRAHSVEAWREGRLVGGLYGVHVGGAFFGESMFSQPAIGGSNSSKICLVHLVEHLRRRGFTLLDTQFWNEHLEQFGCVEIPRDDYLALLREATTRTVSWDWPS